MQNRVVRHARKQNRRAAACGDQETALSSAETLRREMLLLEELEEKAIQAANAELAKNTEEDFAHGGTEATNYMGGGRLPETRLEPTQRAPTQSAEGQECPATGHAKPAGR